MKRSKGITVLSLYFIAMNVITLDYIVGFHLADKVPVLSMLSFLITNKVLMVVWEPLGAVMTILFIALGAFLFSLRELARRVFIWVQGFSILGGLCIAPIEISRWSGGENLIQHAPAILFYSIVFNLCPVIFIVFFTRSKVREQFKQAEEERSRL